MQIFSQFGRTARECCLQATTGIGQWRTGDSTEDWPVCSEILVPFLKNSHRCLCSTFLSSQLFVIWWTLHTWRATEDAHARLPARTHIGLNKILQSERTHEWWTGKDGWIDWQIFPVPVFLSFLSHTPGALSPMRKSQIYSCVSICVSLLSNGSYLQ